MQFLAVPQEVAGAEWHLEREGSFLQRMMNWKVQIWLFPFLFDQRDARTKATSLIAKNHLILLVMGSFTPFTHHANGCNIAFKIPVSITLWQSSQVPQWLGGYSPKKYIGWDSVSLFWGILSLILVIQTYWAVLNVSCPKRATKVVWLNGKRLW